MKTHREMVNMRLLVSEVLHQQCEGDGKGREGKTCRLVSSRLVSSSMFDARRCNPIPSNPIQSNPIQSNPIQYYHLSQHISFSHINVISTHFTLSFSMRCIPSFSSPYRMFALFARHICIACSTCRMSLPTCRTKRDS